MEIKKLFISASAAAALMGGLASCNETLDIIAENSKDVEKREAWHATVGEYTRNFESHYGAIDPNHDWGMTFGAIEGADAQTRATVDNRNEWVSRYHLEVPGWPDVYTYEGASDNLGVNGKYHYLNSGGTNATYEDGNIVPRDAHPAGDVTDEEIAYVSWWFRTNQYPKSENLHWTDFYVQGISADNDRDADGKPITVLERYEKNSSGVWERNGGDENVTYTIDYFSAAVLQPDPSTSDGGWDHIKNYNNGNSNILSGVNDLPMDGEDWWRDLSSNYSPNGYTTPNRLIAFYQSSGTENFRAHYSQNNADLDWNVEYNADGTEKPNSGHSSWVLRHLTFTGKSGRKYDGYYLAFDYQIYKEEEAGVKYSLHKADGYYSNWIFKLSPATPKQGYKKLARRIMCEDLGNTYDFDFNDVVFDAVYNITEEEYTKYLDGSLTDSPIDVTISLQAAGGTMPIWVGDNSETMEAHHLLGHNPSTPVNVNAPGDAKGPVAIYHYQLAFSGGDSEDARKQALSLNKIPIYVQGANGVYLLNPEWGDSKHYTPTDKGSDAAPRAFAVPVGVCWMKECKFIETSYPKFKDWVGDQSKYGLDSASPWYDDDNVDDASGNIFCYEPYAAPANSSAPTIENFDYGQYGTLLPYSKDVIAEYNTDYRIAFADFPKNQNTNKVSGKYVVTAVCVSANSDPAVQNASLQKTYLGNEGNWLYETNNYVNGVVVKNVNNSNPKMYLVQFTVDVNEDFYGDYTHYKINNLYENSTDQVSALYVKRIGDSTQSGNASGNYSEYGTKATYCYFVYNYTKYCALALSSFTEGNGTYTVTAVVRGQNAFTGDWKPSVTINYTNLTDINHDNTSNPAITNRVIDSAVNKAIVQFDVTLPITHASGYDYMVLENLLNGLDTESPIFDILIQKKSN